MYICLDITIYCYPSKAGTHGVLRALDQAHARVPLTRECCMLFICRLSSCVCVIMLCVLFDCCDYYYKLCFGAAHAHVP